MHKGFEMDWQILGEYQQALGDVLWETEDHMEGVRSFTERRRAEVPGTLNLTAAGSSLRRAHGCAATRHG